MICCASGLKTVRRALAGQLDSWAEDAEGLLALIILLDQMTRNIFRDTPMAFAGDDMALALTLKAIDRAISTCWNISQQFLLMPMMHAEDLAIQEASLPLFEKYTNADTYDYAIRHRDIIARFGRFPHRSTILGRPLTAEEAEFSKVRHLSELIHHRFRCDGFDTVLPHPVCCLAVGR